MRRVLLALGLLLLAACPRSGAVHATPTPDPDTTFVPNPKATATPKPVATSSGSPSTDVLIIGATNVIVATDTDGKWTLETRLTLPSPAVVADADDRSLWMITGEWILGYDNSFQRISKVQRWDVQEDIDATAVARVNPLRRKASLDVYDGDAYISEGRKFAVISPGNVTRGSVNIPKTAHSVLVHDKMAFVVDDIMRPLWIHRVDISNPRKLKINSEKVMLVNGHLGVQWLDPANQQWFITSASNTRGGSDLTLRAHPMGKGETAVTTLWSRERRSGETKGPWPAGSYLWRVTPTTPAYGLVRGEKTFFVAAIGDEKSFITLGARWEVPGSDVSDQTPTGFAKNGDRIFVAVGKMLYVLDASGGTLTELSKFELPVEPVDIVSW